MANIKFSCANFSKFCCMKSNLDARILYSYFKHYVNLCGMLRIFLSQACIKLCDKYLLLQVLSTLVSTNDEFR